MSPCCVPAVTVLRHSKTPRINRCASSCPSFVIALTEVVVTVYRVHEHQRCARVRARTHTQQHPITHT